jgi:transcriptional regulator with XRE-family HTH domain
MANELGALIEDRLRERGWTVARFTLESGVSAEVVANLLGPQQLDALPDQATLTRLSNALDVPYRQLVVAAGVACGLPKNQEDEPTFVLRFVTNQELINELRRRLAQGRNHADAQQRRVTHLALMQAALLSGEQASIDT